MREVSSQIGALAMLWSPAKASKDSNVMMTMDRRPVLASLAALLVAAALPRAVVAQEITVRCQKM